MWKSSCILDICYSIFNIHLDSNITQTELIQSWQTYRTNFFFKQTSPFCKTSNTTFLWFPITFRIKLLPWLDKTLSGHLIVSLTTSPLLLLSQIASALWLFHGFLSKPTLFSFQLFSCLEEDSTASSYGSPPPFIYTFLQCYLLRNLTAGIATPFAHYPYVCYHSLSSLEILHVYPCKVTHIQILISYLNYSACFPFKTLSLFKILNT